MENIKLIPNTTTKITLFEAHFGRKPNTQTSNIVTHPNKENLTYNNIKKFFLDKKILRRPMLDQQSMLNFSDSELGHSIQTTCELRCRLGQHPSIKTSANKS